MQSNKFTRRRLFLITFTTLTALLLTLPALRAAAQGVAAASPKEKPYVEFIIGDRIDPDRKWGHVSLRGVDSTRDFIFDFGRYGRMWGKDAEGDLTSKKWFETASSTPSRSSGRPTTPTTRLFTLSK